MPGRSRSAARCWRSARARATTRASSFRIDVAVGDEIVFSKYGGTEIKVGLEDLLILRESDVLAKAVTAKAKGKRELAGATA